MHQLVLECPRPPSINRLWTIGKNRKTGKSIMYRNPRYMAWRRAFGWGWIIARPKGFKTISSDFQIHVVMERKRGSDIDNRAGKALLDACQHFGIIENDSLCTKVVAEYGSAPEGCKITISYNMG